MHDSNCIRGDTGTHFELLIYTILIYHLDKKKPGDLIYFIYIFGLLLEIGRNAKVNLKKDLMNINYKLH